MRNLRLSGLFTCQGTLWNHLETLKVSQELSGTSITAKKGQNGKKGVFKGDGNLDALFKGYGRDSSCSGLLTCKGTLWNQSETMNTSKKSSGKSITAKKGQNGKKGVFKGDGSLNALFSR